MLLDQLIKMLLDQLTGEMGGMLLGQLSGEMGGVLLGQLSAMLLSQQLILRIRARTRDEMS